MAGKGAATAKSLYDVHPGVAMVLTIWIPDSSELRV
jgi:hypothetical protein